MIDRLLFHIGDPKNGSSTIQRALKERAWTCDSVTLAPQKALNASSLATSLRRDDRPRRSKRKWSDLGAWATDTDADLGVVSAEFFAKVNPADLQGTIANYLPAQAESARVLAYVRPHAAWIVSGFGTRVKTGGFDGTLADYTAQLSRTPFLHYAPRFTRWRKIFGERFALRPFLRSELRDGDIAADFFHHALEGAEFSLTPVTDANVSLSVGEIAAMQVVQAELARHGVKKPVRLALGGALGREMDRIPERTAGTRLRLDRDSAVALRDSFREDAGLLDTRFFGRPLMLPALEAAVDEAIATPQPLAAEAHYDAAGIAEMQALAGEIAPLVLRWRKLWRRDYQRGKNPDRADRGPMPGPKQRAGIDRIWERMGRLAQVIAAPSGTVAAPREAQR